MSTRGRRPLGSPDARRAILGAARELFAERGFERTTMRAVGTRAAVDPALIYHYFGDKDGLLAAVVEPPVDLVAALTGIADDPGQAGEEIVRRVIGLWENRPDIRDRMLAMLRTALSHERAAQLLRDMLRSALLGALGDVLADDQRELRAALIGSHLGGLALARYVLKLPGAAAATPEDLVRAVGPAVQRYLTGSLSAAEAPPEPTVKSAGPRS
jgi:AcrR family transcriptional regulator